MWPFSKKQTLAESGFFKGFTDWHCHILPGVDDGVQTMDEALAILAEYERLGIEEVWLTPHIMEDIPNTTAHLRHRFAELQAAYTGNVALHLAAENMLDPLFEQRLAAGDLLPLGPDGNRLLVETSYFNPPVDLYGMLERIKSAGRALPLHVPRRLPQAQGRRHRVPAQPPLPHRPLRQGCIKKSKGITQKKII